MFQYGLVNIQYIMYIQHSVALKLNWIQNSVKNFELKNSFLSGELFTYYTEAALSYYIPSNTKGWFQAWRGHLRERIAI